MAAADWTVYYEDGTAFSSLDGAPKDSPVKLVVCIGVRTHAYTLQGFEWYYWNIAQNEWWASDTNGLLHQLQKNAANIEAVRKGALGADQTQFEKLTYRAYEDRVL